MEILRNTLVIIVALLHLYFLYLEMFMWSRPQGLKIFRMSKEQAQQSAVLAANQGLYNGFLAAGLVWSFFVDEIFAKQILIFFLSCVIVAALYGGYSVSKKILLIQGVPAFLALAVTLAL